MSSIRLNEPTASVETVQGSIPMIVQDIGTVGFYPGVLPTSAVVEDQGLLADEYGAAYTRAGITTDEASLRLNFSGAVFSRALPGTPTWTNGSTEVTGSGFLSLTVPLLVYEFVKQDSDSESAWMQIASITATTITLRAAYTGNSGTGAGSSTNMKPTTGTGGTISVSSSNLVLASGTTNASSTFVSRQVDYGPMTMSVGCTISQRIANQDIYIGFNGTSLDDRLYARFRLSGTTNTLATCETGWANVAPATGTDLQSTSVTYPHGSTSAVINEYRIDIDGRIVAFFINDILVASHKLVVPKPYDILAMQFKLTNGTGASNTTLTIAYIICNNYDSVRITAANAFEPLMVSTQPATDQTYSVAGVIGLNTDIMFVDCTYIRSLNIQCTSMGTSGTVTPAFSNDGGTTFVSPTLVTPAGATATTITAAGLWSLQVSGRLLRLRMTVATSGGTTTFRVMGINAPAPSLQAAVISSGTLTTCSTVTTCSTLTTLANGQTAHSSASTGNPLRIGGRVITTLDTTLAQGDASDIAVTTGQQLLIKAFASAENDWHATGTLSDTTSTQARAVGAASIRNYVTGLEIQLTVLSVSTTFSILDGASTLWSCNLSAVMTTPIAITFPTPLRGTAATALNVKLGTASNTVMYNIHGYQSF